MINFENKKILITRLRFIGDIILSTPLVQTLKERFPASSISYLGEKGSVDVLKNNPYIDEIIPFDFNLKGFAYLKFLNELRKRKFDIVIDLFGNPRSAIFSFVSGARVRIGGDFRGRGRLYNHRINHKEFKGNQIDFHLNFINQFGVKPTTKDTKIFISNEELEKADSLLKENKIEPTNKLIGIYPGATWPAKRYFPEKFAELADKLKNDFEVVFLQSKNDADIISQIKKFSQIKHIYFDPLQLREVAALISRFDILISNDCGIMHIGPAVETNTIGLFGPGENDIWFPYSEEKGHTALRKEIWCHPCHLDFCDRLDCWKLLEVDEIIKCVKRKD